MAYEYDFSRKFSTQKLMEETNICDLMSEDDRKYVGRVAMEGYVEDKQSRREWEHRSAQAMKLALQVMDEKTYPWPGASNVKIPLITTAALNYQARAYPALIDATDLVSCRIFGEDPDGQKTARGERISAHMTWQNIRQDRGWEEAHDKALLVQAIAGNAFIKKMYDPSCRHIVSQLVIPKNFVINYYTRDLESSPRYTHVYELTDNDIRQRELDGRFYKYEESDEVPKTQHEDVGALQEAQDERTGLREPPVGHTTPYETAEQYCWWDFDGDGYAEPYIVTFDIGTGFVRRIVARYLPSGIKKLKGDVYEITPVKVFTKIPFIPSPDGGFYDMGLGQLLGPINEAANTSLNQIIDSGTMYNLGGGFTSRGFKNRGGPFTMRPGEFYPIDNTGKLSDSIMLTPVRDPSNVLLSLVTFLLDWGGRVVAANDIQMGENPGQNTPAETTRTLNENGARVYSAIYKRTWRAFSEEYCVQYDLNQLFLPVSEDYTNLTTGKGAMILKTDYLGPSLDVVPSADPYVVSDAQKLQQSVQLVQASGSLPGFNRYETQRRWLKAMKIPNADAIMPPPQMQGPSGPVPAPDYQPPQDPKMLAVQVKQGQLQLAMQKQQGDQLQARIKLMDEVQESRAKVQNLLAQAQLYEAQAKTEYTEPIIKLIYAEIESEGSRAERLLKLADIMTSNVGAKDGTAATGNGAGLGGADMAQLAGPVSNADFLATSQGGGAGRAGPMGNGQLPVQ